jgi:hypothetical protein
MALMDFELDGINNRRENMKKPTVGRSRCDKSGRALAGSQRQIQHYVNECPGKLQQAVSVALSLPFHVRWVSPLRSDKYREYRDSAFLRACGLHELREELSAFWPSGGPVWDALGAVESTRSGVLLLEAKSHVPEIFGNGCGATAATSIQKIESSLQATQIWLGVPNGTDWRGELYQAANRLAHLYFFREILHMDAWLVNVYFIDDPYSRTSRAEWVAANADVKRKLGISEISFCADVYLPALC